MFIQIEITTVCNLRCFYCAGRDMPQRHMDAERFHSILRDLPRGRHTVSLQGEGEPTLHPQFWEYVKQVAQAGHLPYTITNGTRLDPKQIAAHLPRLGISIDTLDPTEAKRIGRHGLNRTLRNLKRLLDHYPTDQVTVYTVDYGQRLDDLRQFVRELSIGSHVIQPLQTKSDYSYRYPEQAPYRIPEYTYRCRYITPGNVMHFYNIDGTAMPCCFIKDARNFVSIEAIRRSFAAREVPRCCEGCREIARKKSEGIV